MIRNYLKIAWRNLLNNKVFSLINIVSLAIGLSASFVIGLMVYYDFTFDKFHKDKDLIYRVTTDYSSPEGERYNSGVAVPLTVAINQGITGVNKATVFFTAEPVKVMNPIFTKAINNPERVIFADSVFFDFFNYIWLAGNAKTALKNPNELVLTASRAKSYFPKKEYSEILGQTLTYGDSTSAKITGILADFEERTDLTFQEFISLETAKQSYMKDEVMDDNWNSTSSSTQLFIKLNEKKSLNNVQRQLDVLAKEHESENSAKYNSHRTFNLQSINDLHFSKDYGVFDFTENNADKTVLLSLMFIALFLLALGCINFIDLNTAQATRRSKEIGIRKTLGSSKKQLVLQFLAETLMLTLLAAALSIILASGLLKVFADFLPSGLHFGLFADPMIIGFGGALILLVTLFSGFYPALILSSYKPVSVLNNRLHSGKSKASFRKGLTIFQFIIAQVFIISTILVGKQIHYLTKKDMGFKTEAITYIRTPWQDNSMQKRELFIQKLKAIPQIEQMSLGGAPPASFSTHATEVDFVDGKKEIHSTLELLYGDAHYLDLYTIKLLAGRTLRNDTVREYVINETYSKILGFKTPQDAIAATIGIDKAAYPILGVMADFNQRSLKTKIEPMALIGDWSRDRYSQFNTVHLQLNIADSENWPTTIAKVEDAWQSIYPASDFEMKFIDQTVSDFYKSENSITKLLNWATGLSVLISCLGLLGLVIYTTERRVKEIGIRKILGASLVQLNVLLCKDFLALVLLAFVIAAPIAWYGVHEWLQDYAYKTELSWWIFVLNGLAMTLLALIIISLKTIHTAMKNPVESLRTE